MLGFFCAWVFCSMWMVCRIIKKPTKPTDNSNLAARPDALWPSRSLQSRLADRLLSKTHYPGPDVVDPDFKIRRSLCLQQRAKNPSTNGTTWFKQSSFKEWLKLWRSRLHEEGNISYLKQGFNWILVPREVAKSNWNGIITSYPAYA